MGASDNFFQKAEQAFKKKNYEYAIALYQQGLAIDPDRVDERRKLRAAAIRKCQEGGGSTTGGRMLKVKMIGAFTNIRTLGMKKKFEEQIVEIEKILAVAPQHGESLMSLAAAFQSTNRIDSARQAYQEVVEIEPANTDAWKSLGRLYEGQKELDKAVQCWERVKQLTPEDAEAGKAIRDLSAAVMMQKTDARKAQSKDDSFKALLKDEDESEKLQKKAQLIRTSDDAQVALQLKREEIAKTPGNSRLWRELGDLHAKVRQFDEAETAFRKAAEVNPQDMYAAEKIAQLTEQRIQAGIEDAKIALKDRPEDAAAKSKLERLLSEQNEFLLGEYARRVAAHPTDFKLKFDFGEILLRNGRYDEAIGQFQNARKDPKFAVQSHHRIGKAFHAKKLYDLAIRELTNSLAGITDRDTSLWKTVQYDLAESQEAKGEKPKALELFEEIMSVDINFRDVSRRVDALRT